jgi:hypothetical protein
LNSANKVQKIYLKRIDETDEKIFYINNTMSEKIFAINNTMNEKIFAANNTMNEKIFAINNSMNEINRKTQVLLKIKMK